MIKKLKKKIVIYSSLSIFILLALVFLIVNITNFSLIANNADKITEAIMRKAGKFEGMPQEGSEFDRPMGPMGPYSPEMQASSRFFSISFDKDGNANVVEYRLTEQSMSQEEAIELARKLLDKRIGWVNTIYRYRTYKENGIKYVIVLDQDRELTPSFNVLWISLISLILGTLISTLILIKVSSYLIKPVEESDRKQKRFIKDATYALKTPTTIIDEANEMLRSEKNEKLNDTIKLELKKMNDLIDNMNTISILDDPKKVEFSSFNVKEEVDQVVSFYLNQYKENNIDFKLDVSSDIEYNFDKSLFRRIIQEVVDNGWKYSLSNTNLKLQKNEDRLTIEMVNDCLDISEGDQSRVFERFYRIDNDKTKKIDGNGMGLAVVYEIVNKYNGRASAKVVNKLFILKIEI
jgi:hypothetical protein